MNVNVDGSDDASYRYKMPPLKVEYVARKGGITVIANADVVSHCIYRELSDLKTYYSKALGGKVSILEKTLVIPGTKTVSELQELLQKYIMRDVLCVSCKNPETVSGKCQACGKKLK